MKPSFTIILTTYNRSHFLPRAIHSVLQQTFTDFELIIIDDHSTDNTKQVIGKFSDQRIVYIQQPENKGVSTARNTGIQHAKGTYICFLDDDDEYLPDFLKEIQLFLEKKQHPFIGLIWTGIAKVYTLKNNKGKERIETELFTLNNDKTFLMNVLFSGITIHRHCFERAGIFNPTLKLKEDTDLIFRILTLGFDYTLICKILIKIHLHEHISLSRSINRIDRIDNMERFLAVHNKFLNKNLGLWLLLYTSLVGDYYHSGKKKQARKLVFRICKKKWFSPKIWELFLRFELLKPLKTYLSKCRHYFLS